MKSRYYAGAGWTACAVILCLCCAPAFATSYITGTSTATLETTGEYAGYYKYTIEIEWNLGGGLSHWNLILKPECVLDDHWIKFDTPSTAPDGYTKNALPGDFPSHPWTIPDETAWQGFFEPGGDKSLEPPEDDIPVVKFNEPDEDHPVPGQSGYGTFWFYSNIIPEDAPVGNLFLIYKDGVADPYDYGELTGDYPSCEVIPEPLTMVGVFMGVCGLAGYIRRKRRRA